MLGHDEAAGRVDGDAEVDVVEERRTRCSSTRALTCGCSRERLDDGGAQMNARNVSGDAVLLERVLVLLAELARSRGDRPRPP